MALSRIEPCVKRATAEAMALLVGGAAILALLAWALHGFAGPSPRFLAGAFGLYLPASYLVVRHVGVGHPFDHFGLPNSVTLVRLVLSSLFGGVVLDLDATPLADSMAWVVLAVAAVALMLDGVDGALARALRRESSFGARFDMEVDALLILLLSLLAWLLAKAGPWVLLIGALRYAFVVAGWLWPPLARPLPPSFRRKAVCVVQGVALTVLLVPFVTPPFSVVVAAAALILILYSFAVDVLWLVAHRRET